MGKLYIVATPIGNLEDITLRALRVLKEADLILCEDTRVTRKLLEHYSIGTPTLSYHQHSSQFKLNKVISLISPKPELPSVARFRASQSNQEKSIALVTDAGTPGLSDPGGKLVAAALCAGIVVESIPGPSALTAAVSLSGLPMGKFLFLGFLPHKKGRQTLLDKIVSSDYPVILYESVHRINKLIEELACPPFARGEADGRRGIRNKELGNRQIVICRELTKKFETVYRGTVEEVKNQLSRDKTKGEFVVIINANKMRISRE